MGNIERIKTLLNYEPETGVFRWASNRGIGVKKDAIAGTINSKGYVVIRIETKVYRAHRLAFLYVYGVDPEEVDHINGIRTDNRISNLRQASRLQNAKNRKIQINNTSGHPGVVKNKKTGKWQARCKLNKKQIYLGEFDQIDDAISVRNKYVKEHFGEFLRRN